MLDLILWSFMIALTPWALGLGWKLLVDVRQLPGIGPSRDLEVAERMATLSSLKLKPLSTSGSNAGRASCSWH
jgi:hypothetical protein